MASCSILTSEADTRLLSTEMLLSKISGSASLMMRPSSYLSFSSLSEQSPSTFFTLLDRPRI